MAIAIASATAADFRPFVGTTFQITFAPARMAEGTLTEVEERGIGRPGGRTPFALRFAVPDPSAARPQQGTFVFAHPEAGEHTLFAVPLGKRDGVVEWEVILA